MGDLVRDTRVAARMLWRSPGFTAVALVTIALGIGGNTAMFSVVNAVLLRPLPYARPERLVAVYQTLPSRGISSNGVSWLNYSDWAARTRSFEALGAIRMHDFTLTGQGEPALVAAGTLTSNVFALLGSAPLAGRGLLPSDDAPDAPPVAVLTEKLWHERFGGDAAALGKTVFLDQRPFTIVGVMPGVFKTPPNIPPAELWTPLPKDPVFEDLRQRRGGHYLTIVGRLKDGVSIARAEAELSILTTTTPSRHATDRIALLRLLG